MIPLLSSLRAPPIVGRFYMVPNVEDRFGRLWPVIGPRHEDVEELNFPALHFHVDYRFCGRAEIAYLRSRYPQFSPEMAVNNLVLTGNAFYEIDGSLSQTEPPPAQPTLHKRICRRSTYTFLPQSRRAVARRLGRTAFATVPQPAEPLRLADGRILCPHRKVDLSQFPHDRAGVVVCPLHGLKVQCVPLAALPASVTLIQEEFQL